MDTTLSRTPTTRRSARFRLQEGLETITPHYLQRWQVWVFLLLPKLAEQTATTKTEQANTTLRSTRSRHRMFPEQEYPVQAEDVTVELVDEMQADEAPWVYQQTLRMLGSSAALLADVTTLPQDLSMEKVVLVLISEGLIIC